MPQKNSTQTVYTVRLKNRYLKITYLDERPLLRWVRDIERAERWTRNAEALKVLLAVRLFVGPSLGHMAFIVP